MNFCERLIRKIEQSKRNGLDDFRVSTGFDGKIYAVGGFSYKAGPFGDVTTRAEIYDPLGNAWSELPPMPEPEYGPATVTGTDCRLYVIGAAAGYGVSGQVKIFEPLTDRKSVLDKNIDIGK